MGELHALYRSQMRLYRDRPDVLVWGRWRWCPPGALPVPFPHAFTPYRNWPEWAQHDTGEVGEIPHSERTLRDDPIARYLGQNVCGSAEVWLLGGLYADRGSIARDPDGIPLCCISGPPPPGGAVCGGEAEQGLVSGVEWRNESAWSAVYETVDRAADAWRNESAWSASPATVAHYSDAWRDESAWSAVGITRDNVTTFTCATLVATGSTQGTAAALAADDTSVTSTGVAQGVILPAQCARLVVRNANGVGGNTILVYPNSGATITTSLVNVGTPISAGAALGFVEFSATHWGTFPVTA